MIVKGLVNHGPLPIFKNRCRCPGVQGDMAALSRQQNGGAVSDMERTCIHAATLARLTRVQAFMRMAPAFAALATFLLLALFAAVPAFAAGNGQNISVAYAYKAAADENRARIIVHFEKEPNLHWFMLMHPNRLVIDLPRTRFGFDPKSLEPRGMIEKVRYGLVSDSSSRLIISIKGPFKVENLRFENSEDGPDGKLMIDLVSVS